MTPAIELTNVTKIYKRYGGRQFSTLKSALLRRSLLKPAENDRSRGCHMMPATALQVITTRFGSW